MAFTLADFARLADSPLKRGVIDVFRRESFVMDYLKWESVKSLAVQVNRTKGLPSVAFRKIGASFSESKATFEPVVERIFDVGGFIDVDKVLVKSDPKQRGIQTDAFLTALSYLFNDYFINGDPTVDIDGFTGLFYRIVSGGLSAQEKNINGLDISPDAAGLSANLDTFLDAFDESIELCEGHQCDFVALNKTLKLRLSSAMRSKGLLNQSQDQFGRRITQYGPDGPFIRDVGTKADQTTLIIGNTETDSGAAKTGGNTTSAYFIRTGEKFLMGMYLYDIDVQDIGLLESGVAYRTVVDWPVGIMHINPRSYARLSGVEAA